MDVTSIKYIHSLHKPAVLIALIIFLGIISSPSFSSEAGVFIHLDYLSVYPEVQVPGHNLTSICIIYPIDSDISVDLIFLNPLDIRISVEMEYDHKGKFVGSFQGTDIGEYIYWVEISNDDGLLLKSHEQSFWIAFSLNDRDSDGLPDSWEKVHGFDGNDPFDASTDPDGDGYSNREEYEMGTDPLENIFFENTLYRLRSNADMVFLSFFAFFSLFIGGLFGIWRSRTWV